MQLSRLFELVYLLLDRKGMTADELAEHFEVSRRTIYRDVDTLAQAGIPIYAERGKGGGIRLTEQFVLNKSVLSAEERRSLLAALRGMEAVGPGGAGPVLDKLSALFGGEEEDWLQVDFSAWSPDSPLTDRFRRLREAIFRREVLTFLYSGAAGGTEVRNAEPMKLVFRGNDWYLLAWCRRREDFRYFKLTRMDGVEAPGERFRRRALPPPATEDRADGYGGSAVDLEARIAPTMAFRVRDEFPPERREELPDGGFRVRLRLPDNEWMYEYLMTYGGALRVLSPERVRQELARRHRAAWETNKEEDG